jgi:hypothetical protein
VAQEKDKPGKDKDADGSSAMPSVTLTKITKRANGSVEFRFGKIGLDFNSVADAAAFAQGQLSGETLRAQVIAMVLTRQPALGNPGIFEGKVLNVDFNAAVNWGTVT